MAMLERFRAFLDRPLDPGAGRAIVACASAAFLGLGVLVVLGAVDVAERPGGEGPPPVAASTPAATLPLPAEVPGQSTAPAPSRHRQDPQDVPGSGAARRVARALREARALQHVPYRRGELTIELVGARGGKAVLRVRAPGAAEARRGWREFLHRYRDGGRAYAPIFRTSGGR
jgi:hypothetical protein